MDGGGSRWMVFGKQEREREREKGKKTKQVQGTNRLGRVPSKKTRYERAPRTSVAGICQYVNMSMIVGDLCGDGEMEDEEKGTFKTRNWQLPQQRTSEQTNEGTRWKTRASGYSVGERVSLVAESGVSLQRRAKGFATKRWRTASPHRHIFEPVARCQVPGARCQVPRFLFTDRWGEIQKILLRMKRQVEKQDIRKP